MAIPTFDAMFSEALKVANRDDGLRYKEFAEPLAKVFQLTEDEVAKEYESGNGNVFLDRISWSLSALYRSGMLEKPKRGVYKISEKGKNVVVSENPNQMAKDLYKEFKATEKEAKIETEGLESVDGSNASTKTPHEVLNDSYETILESIYDEIIDTILLKTPKDFEFLVVKLLQKMGYGGQVVNSGAVTQYSNDGGIDGVIKEDVLGLGVIHIQAKRNARNNSVGREEVQKFVGALAVARSNKGIFITTSTYSKGAFEYAQSLNGATNLVLID